MWSNQAKTREQDQTCMDLAAAYGEVEIGTFRIEAEVLCFVFDGKTLAATVREDGSLV